MIELKGKVYTSEGSRIATEEDNREFKEALDRGEVMTLYEYMEPLRKWKRDQISTPVKTKQYHRNMIKFLTGKETIVPNTAGMRRAVNKVKQQQ